MSKSYYILRQINQFRIRPLIYLSLVGVLLAWQPSIVFAQAFFTNDRTYELSVSNNNGAKKLLAIAGGRLGNGGKAVLWEDANQDDIRWVFERVTGSRYKIRNRKSGRYLAVSGGSTRRGTRIIQWEDVGQEDLLWDVLAAQGGKYSFRNVKSRLFLAVGGGKVENGRAVIQWPNVGQPDVTWNIKEEQPTNIASLVNINPKDGRRFGYNRQSQPPKRPLLVVLSEFSDQRLDRSVGFYENLIFGPNFPNAVDLFRAISNNKFTFSRVAVVRIRHNFASTRIPRNFDQLVIAKGIRKARLNIRDFDVLRNDRKISSDELAILSINANLPQGSVPGGQERPVGAFNIGTTTIDLRIASTHVGGDINLYAHELFHHLEGVSHIYGPGASLNTQATFYGPSNWTSASSPGPIYLDPYNRILSGWINPQVFYPTETRTRAWISSQANASFSESPIVLRDLGRSGREFFILEHRDSPTVPYDVGGLGSGMAIWYVQSNVQHKPISISWPPPFSGPSSSGNMFANYMIGAGGIAGQGRWWNSTDGTASLLWGDGSDSGLRVKVISKVGNNLQVEWWRQ